MILNSEQSLIRDTARSFASDVLRPNAAQNDALCQFPEAAIEAMAELGFFGMLLPEQYGGVATDNVSYALALEEIAFGEGATSTIMSVHNSVGYMPILRFGTTEQKERLLPDMATGKKLAAFCLTEPDAGSDASAINTKATKIDDGYSITGVKQFITSGKHAKVAIVFARTGEGKKGISAFIVHTDNPGYKVRTIEEKLGQRASETCQIEFDSCKVSNADLLGSEGQGYKIALSNLEGGRIGIAAQSVGMARSAYELALAYATERKSFGVAIIEHQAIAFKLADMATQIDAARLLVLRAASLKDADLPCLVEASMAKLFASEMAEKVCSEAIQIHGGYGILKGYEVERIARDVRVCQIYEGTSEIQRMVISRSLKSD